MQASLFFRVKPNKISKTRLDSIFPDSITIGRDVYEFVRILIRSLGLNDGWQSPVEIVLGQKQLACRCSDPVRSFIVVVCVEDCVTKRKSR